MKKIKNILFLMGVFFSDLVYGQMHGRPTMTPGGPNTRSIGPGSPNPIDMYEMLLFVAAIVLAGFVYLKLNKRQLADK